MPDPTGSDLVDAFFEPWEKQVPDFETVNESITNLFQRLVREEDRLFAWRGVVNASWPLHSSLYRRMLWTQGVSVTAPLEDRMAETEGRVLRDVHRWGLHNSDRGRMSVLSQLAALQHFGAPTRLIDVTMNAYIGLWFAVQPEYRNGIPVDSGDEADGRLFAIDVTDRLMNEIAESPEDPNDRAWTARRSWEDETIRPWKDSPWAWTAHTWAWKPPHFEARIAAQNGAFLFGGVPRSGRGLRWPLERGPQSKSWGLDQVRRCISVPLRMHVVEPGGGGAQQPAYTFRIAAAAKSEIRERLRVLFGYEHATIYPDLPGFAAFGRPHLRTKPR